MADPIYEGGCLCGAIRYRATGASHEPHYCHCRICQRAVGAPLVAWVGFPLAGFAYTRGAPARFRSSPHLRRAFCPTCGSSIANVADDDRHVSVALASLDDPEAIVPAFHIWTASEVAWLRIDDRLPRHQGQP